MSRTKRAVQALFFLLTVTVAGSCGSVLGDDEYATERERLAAAREAWAARGWDSYSFVLQRLCYCAGGTDPADVVVEAGVRVSVTSRLTGESIPEEWQQYYLTVPELFDFIEDAIDRKAFSIDVTYASGAGWPTHIAIDYLENAIDEEMAFEASALTPGS